MKKKSLYEAFEREGLNTKLIIIWKNGRFKSNIKYLHSHEIRYDLRNKTGIINR